MSTAKGKLFHLAVVVYYAVCNYHIFSHLVPRVLTDLHPVRDNMYSMTVQFATVWAQVMQQVYFFCCLLGDVLDFTPDSKWTNFKLRLSEFTHTFFTCYTFPFSIVVALNFWILFAHDPLNLDPYNALFEYISVWLNHVIHTNIVPLVLVEMCLNYRQHPASVRIAAKNISFTFLAYLITVLLAQPFCSIWVYPFFGTMTFTQVIGYIVANLVCCAVAYLAGHTINALVWGQHEPLVFHMGHAKQLYKDVIRFQQKNFIHFDKFK